MTESTESVPMVLTVDEAAAMLRISRQSAYQAVHAGEIPVVRVGRRMLVPRAALEKMLDLEQRPGVEPEASREAEATRHALGA
jgi:excisionase family DNA binding protein